MKSLLLLVAIFTLAYGQEITLNRNANPQEIPIVVNEGNNVTFRCTIPSVSIVVSVRLPGGSAFGTDIPANVIREGDSDVVTITVVNAQRNENLLAFQCAGGGLSTDIGVLTVYYAPNYTNPGNQMLTEGMNAVVTVPLDANPIPDFTWTRDNMPVSAMNVDLNASTIVFNPARRENTGTYTIFGNNSAGSDSTTFEVVVNYIPAFDVETGNLNCSGSDPITCAIRTGANGTLQCLATGSPPPTVTATRDPSTANSVEFMNNQFFITSADATTAGTYSCNASNSVGSDVRTFRLWVGGTPTLNALMFSMNDTHVGIMWTFNDTGVPVSPFMVTIVCGSQSFTDNVNVPMMGYEVTLTRALTAYPADTSCTVTVRTSNLLGFSNTLENTFMTPTEGTSTSTTEIPTTSGGAAFSAAIFSVLLLMIASLVF